MGYYPAERLYRQQPSESRQLKLSRVTDDKLLDELYGMELYVVF